MPADHLAPWKRLGAAVVRRRVELGFKTREAFADAAGLSTKTLGQIERGERSSYDPATIAAVEQALDWPANHIDTILHTRGGDDPLVILGRLLRIDERGVQTLPAAAEFPPGSPERAALDALEEWRARVEPSDRGPRPWVEIVHHGPGSVAESRRTAVFGAERAVVPQEPPELQTAAGVARYLWRDDLVLVALLHRAGLSEVDLFKLILRVRARREQQNTELVAEVAEQIRAAGGWVPEPVWPPTWLVGDPPTSG